MADEWGQHQRSGSSGTTSEDSHFSNTVGEGTAKTDENRLGNAEEVCAGTDETAKSVDSGVLAVLAVPPRHFGEISAFARSAQLIGYSGDRDRWF